MNQNYLNLVTGLSARAKPFCAVSGNAKGSSGSANRKLSPVRSWSWPFAVYSLLFLLLFNSWSGFSQTVSNYSFAAGTGGTLDPMAGSTDLVPSGSDDGNSSVTAIGFSFTYAGTAYTQFSAAANGFIRLGSSTPATGITNYSNTASNGGSQSPAILPYWDDLHTGTSGKVHYVLTGSAPNRILKVEWFVTVPRSTSGAANARFQCWLHEGTNEVKFIYGAGMVSNSSNSGYSIGLITSSTVYNSVAAGVNSTTTFATSTTAAIAEGTTYTFTPPPPCTGTPVAGSIAVTQQNVCSGSTPASITAAGYSTGLPGLGLQWEQSANGTDWANVTGGTGATTATYTPPSFTGTTIQYRMKITCSSSGQSATTNAATVSIMAAPSTQATALAASGFNSAGGTVSWTNGNGNRRVVIISNTTIVDPVSGSGPALTANAAYSGSGQQIIYDGTGTSVTVTGLTGGTYNVKVYEYYRCGSSAPYTSYYNLTAGTNTAVVNNTCAAISTFPWTESFEGVTTGSTVVGTATGLPNCWNSESTKWSSTTDATYNTARTGTKYIRYAWSTTNAVLWTPGFQLQAGVSYDFSFFAQGDGWTGWNTDVYVNSSASVTGATQLTPTYTAAGPGSLTLQQYAKVTRTFTPSSTGVYYFALRGNQSSGSPYYMAFDDFELKLTPNCVNPGSLAVATSNGTTANLSWAAPSVGSAPTGYEYAFTTSSTPPASGTTISGTSVTGVSFTASTNYYLHVRSVCSAEDKSAWATSAVFKYVPGDVCAFAFDLGALTSPLSGTTVGFANDVSLSCGSTSNTAPDVYYKITVPANYSLTIGFTASNFDSVRSLAYGSCAALTQIQCRDTELTAETWANYTGQSQTVYYIIDGYSSGSGTYTLNWTLSPPPSCLPPSALAVNFNNTTATGSWAASDSAPANGYRYEIRSSGAAGSGNTGLVASGDVTALLTNPAAGLTVGSSYTMYVRSVCSGSDSSAWASLAFTVPSPNDTCATAVTINCGDTLAGSTLGATNENMAVCGISGVTVQNTPGVWYKFTGDGRDVTISTCSSASGDTRLAVYTGACNGTMTCVTGNDDNGACTVSTTSSEVLFSTVNGTEYYVLVYNYTSSSSKTFEIKMTCVVPCTPATANDECATATALTVGTPLASHNTCSTPSTGVAYPSCGSSFATYYDAWYSFNSGSNTVLEVSVLPTTPATAGYVVYSGTCGALTQVTSSCFTTGAANNITLTANTNYYVRVYTNGSAGRGAYTVSVKVPCLVPTGLASSAVAAHTATINWNAPASVPGSGYQYEVRTSGAAGSGATGLVTTNTVTGLTANLTSLASETQHSVYVRSVCGAGDNSPWTSASTFTTLPSCYRPTGLTNSAVTATTATISWTAPTQLTPTNGYVYEVRTSGAAGSGATGLAQTSTAAGTTVNLTQLTPQTAYSVYVRSHCDGTDYSSWTAVSTFTTLPTCYRPTGVVSSLVTGTTATIGWTAPTQVPSTGYQWEVRTSGAAGSGSTGLFQTSTTTGTSAGLTALNPSTTYSVYVRSHCDGNDYSTWTSVVTFRTKAANDACSGAIAVTCGGTVSGSLSDATNENMPVCGISGVTVQNTPGVWYKYVSNGTDVTFSTCSIFSDDTRLAVYTGSCGNMTCVGGNDDNDDCLDQDLSSEVTISTVSGTTYYILVYSFSTSSTEFDLSVTCAPACSPAAGNNECIYAQGITLGSTTATHNTCATASLGYAYPSCGSSFSTYYDTWYKFNTGANTTVTVSTSATAPVVVGYAVYSGTCGALTQVNASCNPTGAATTLTGLTPHTVYYVRAYSSSATARGNFNLNLSVPCNVPTGLAVVPASTSITASWTASTSAPQNGYEYEVRTSGVAGSGATGLAASGTSSLLNATIGSLTPNTSYSVYVRSVCATGTYSSWTAAVTTFTGYCVAAPTSVNGSGITNVTFDIVNNTTGAETGNYHDYTALVGVGVRNEPVTVTVTHSASQFTKIWVDWNNDMDFSDAGEAVYTSSSSSTTATATFTIPDGATLGTHRMRIAGGNASSITACYTGANASYEDYTLDVQLAEGNYSALLAEHCNAVVTSFNQSLFANFISRTTEYRFRVRNGANTQYIVTPNRWMKINMLTTYAYGQTYLIDVAIKRNDVWEEYGPACKVMTPPVPATQLENCGAVITNFNESIFANTVQGATAYRFKVSSSEGTFIVDGSGRWFKLNQMPVYSYGVTYTVSVAVFSGNIWSAYGPACTISTTLTTPSTQLKPEHCGAVLSSFNSAFWVTPVPQATMYHFTVTSVHGTEVISTPNTWIKLNMLSNYDYNEQYAVTVTASAPGATMSVPGSSCTVISPDLPVISIRAAECNATLPSRNTNIIATGVTKAVSYQFRVQSMAGTHVLTRNTYSFKISMLPAGFVQAGETVTVDIRTISANGSQSAYGPTCTLTLSNNAGRMAQDSDVSVKPYPNPFTDSFAINITSESQEMVDIVVYDMAGKLVETMKVEAAQLPELRLGSNLAAGVYNLIVTQGSTVKTLRVIKNVN